MIWLTILQVKAMIFVFFSLCYKMLYINAYYKEPLQFETKDREEVEEGFREFLAKDNPKLNALNEKTSTLKAEIAANNTELSKTFPLTKNNIDDMMNFRLFKYENYCKTCTEWVQPKGHFPMRKYAKVLNERN